MCIISITTENHHTHMSNDTYHQNLTRQSTYRSTTPPPAPHPAIESRKVGPCGVSELPEFDEDRDGEAYDRYWDGKPVTPEQKARVEALDAALAAAKFQAWEVTVKHLDSVVQLPAGEDWEAWIDTLEPVINDRPLKVENTTMNTTISQVVSQADWDRCRQEDADRAAADKVDGGGAGYGSNV